MTQSAREKEVYEALMASVEARQAVTGLEHSLQSATELAKATGDYTKVVEMLHELNFAHSEETAARKHFERVHRNSPTYRLVRLIRRTLARIGHAITKLPTGAPGRSFASHFREYGNFDPIPPDEKKN